MLNVVGELVSHGSWLEIAFSFYLDVDELRFCMLLNKLKCYTVS